MNAAAWPRARDRGSIRDMTRLPFRLALMLVALGVLAAPLHAQRTEKPPLHAKHWIAITGKPLAATAGAMMFVRGGNAVDAACAMLGAEHHLRITLGYEPSKVRKALERVSAAVASLNLAAR